MIPASTPMSKGKDDRPRENERKSAQSSGDLEPPLEVAAGVVFRDGKLLITQRRVGDHLGGFWEFPGGKRECDETFETCLRRELSEELGIEVEVGKLIDTVFHQYPEKTVQLKFFHCAWRRNEPRPLACEAVRWVSREELARYLFPGADFGLIDKLRREQAWWQRD